MVGSDQDIGLDTVYRSGNDDADAGRFSSSFPVLQLIALPGLRQHPDTGCVLSTAVSTL